MRVWIYLPWPLFAVWGLQIALSLRLLWTNTAFIDEATYLYAGHQMVAHWLHGTPVEPFPTFLSGSPAIYPPLGALADSLAGLAGARFLGLAFMLATTGLLYDATRRLADRRAAAFAALLFASLSGTQFLSAFATYDPMAIFLLALSAHLVIRYGNELSLTGAALAYFVAPLTLALADATKYATALWDPIVIVLVGCMLLRAGASFKKVVVRLFQFTAILVGAITLGLLVGNAPYVHGILYTTVARSNKMAQMGQPPGPILWAAWTWIGLVLVLGAAGAALLLFDNRSASVQARLAIGAVLLAAGMLAPLNQARIGTVASLQKHVVYGAWFTCVLGGYAISRLTRFRFVQVGAFVALFAWLPFTFTAQAAGFYAWQTTNPAFITGLKALVHGGTDRYLIESSEFVPAYYVGAVNSIQWKESGDYSYRDPGTGVTLYNEAALNDAVKHRVFQMIILDFNLTTSGEIANDDAVRAAIAQYGDYRIIEHLPPSLLGSHEVFTVWQLTAPGGN